MVKFTYLLQAVDSAGSHHIFRVDDGCICVKCGDLVLYDGAILIVEAKCYTDVESDEYKMFKSILGIKIPDKIYQVSWEKNMEVKR